MTEEHRYTFYCEYSKIRTLQINMTVAELSFVDVLMCCLFHYLFIRCMILAFKCHI